MRLGLERAPARAEGERPPGRVRGQGKTAQDEPAAVVARALCAALPVPAAVCDGEGRVLWQTLEWQRRFGGSDATLRNWLSTAGERPGLEGWNALLSGEVEAVDGPAWTADLERRLLPEERLASFRHRDAAQGGELTVLCVLADGEPLLDGEGAPADRWTTLSSREKEIAELAIRGYTVGNIAARLGVAQSTVKTHLKRLYRKLGVFNRAELAYRLLGAPTPTPPPRPLRWESDAASEGGEDEE